MPAAALGALINAGIVTFCLWNAVPTPELVVWFSATAFVAGWQFFRRPADRARAQGPLSARTLRRVVTNSAISALPWSFVVTFYLGVVPHTAELVLIAIGAGMAASGSVFLAPIYPAALSYMAVILFPVALKCYLLAASGYGPLGVLTLSYAGFLYAVIATKAKLSVELSQSNELLRQRDELISAQNLRFETALNNMTQGLCFFDREERLIVCNRRYIDMYGLDPERVRPGVSLSDIVGMRYAAGACPQISEEEYLAWRSRAGNADRPSDTVYRLKNGRMFAIHYRPMADGAWVATTDDITERHELSEKLSERTALLQAIIDNFPGGIGFYDKDLRVVVCNDTAKSILDLPEQFFAAGPPRLEDILRFNAERGEYGPGNVEEQVAARLTLIVPFRGPKPSPSGEGQGR